MSLQMDLIGDNQAPVPPDDLGHRANDAAAAASAARASLETQKLAIRRKLDNPSARKLMMAPDHLIMLCALFGVAYLAVGA